jgi:predicted flap endonuclease-1-like 5' DNA nuclease
MGMEQGVALAISGYTYNSHDLYVQGMVKFAEIAQYFQPDMDRITNAEKTCSKVAR